MGGGQNNGKSIQLLIFATAEGHEVNGHSIVVGEDRPMVDDYASSEDGSWPSDGERSDTGSDSSSGDGV